MTNVVARPLGRKGSRRPDAVPDPDFLRALERLSEDDRRWFKARPSRSFRLRKPAKGELEMLGDDRCNHVVVEQLAPGVRARLPVLIVGGLPDCDAVLRKLIHEGFVQVGAGGVA